MMVWYSVVFDVLCGITLCLMVLYGVVLTLLSLMMVLYGSVLHLALRWCMVLHCV